VVYYIVVHGCTSHICKSTRLSVLFRYYNHVKWLYMHGILRHRHMGLTTASVSRRQASWNRLRYTYNKGHIVHTCMRRCRYLLEILKNDTIWTLINTTVPRSCILSIISDTLGVPRCSGYVVYSSFRFYCRRKYNKYKSFNTSVSKRLLK